MFLGSEVDMAAGPAALFFDLGEMGEFTPVWFGLVVPSDGVEAWAIGLAVSNEHVRHTDNRRGVHAAAEFGEDWAVGAEPSLDGFRQDGAEVFFIFSVSAVMSFLVWIEIPIPANTVISGPEEHGRGRRDGMNPDVRRQIGVGKGHEPAGDVLFANREGSARKQDEWI